MPPEVIPAWATPGRGLLLHFGQLGDAVMALPAAVALREATPRTCWTVLASAGADAIFRLAGFADVWSADRVRWKRAPLAAAIEVPALLWRLRRERFARVLDLHSYKETNLLAWLTGARERVAMLRPTRSWPRLITRPPKPDDPYARLVDRYCEVVGAVGVEVADRVPRLHPPALVRARVEALFAAWQTALGGSVDAPVLGICPGAGHPGRRWPAERFAALIRDFQSASGTGGEASSRARVAVFAGPEESAAVLDPLQRLPRTEIWRGLTIAELAAALGLCRVVVSNPTGPSHIAAAVGASVLTLGEIPAFDPVAQPPAAVVAVRAPRAVGDIGVGEAGAALARLWAAAARLRPV